MLPNGYINLTALRPYPGSNTYIDTGVKSASGLTIDALFGGVSSGYQFGARNTNSNTSAGQLGFYYYYNQTNYFCYNNNRTSLGNNIFSSDYVHFHISDNDAEIVDGEGLVTTASATSATFTGNNNMFIFAMNNNGSALNPVYSTFYGMVISKNGTLEHLLTPCYEESSGQYGVYDEIALSFCPLSSTIGQTLYKVNFDQTIGGEAYAKTVQGYLVKSIYGGNTSSHTIGQNQIKCKAIANEGYSFFNWTDSHGNIVSTEKEFTYSATTFETLTANFIKETEIQNNGFRAMIILYGTGEQAQGAMNPIINNIAWTKVRSAEITVDGLQKSSSTIVCEEVPSTFQINCPIFVYSSKGNIVYYGVIKQIDGNTLQCREPLSIFDADFEVGENSGYAKHFVCSAMKTYMRFFVQGFDGQLVTAIDYLRSRLGNNYSPMPNTWELPLYEKQILNVTAPSITGNSIINLEDYLLGMFDDFGVYVQPSLYGREFTNGKNYFMNLKTVYYAENDTIVISDNYEKIQDVSIQLEDSQYTCLEILNVAGTSRTASYGLLKAGGVDRYDTITTTAQGANFVAYDNFKQKIVMSNENKNTLIAQYLTNGQFNHKITFNLISSSLVEDINVNIPVDFYYKNKLYKSVVTGIKFSINENSDVIESKQITLGKVRNNLTSKINLKK